MKFQGGFSILHINFAQLHTVFNYINLFFRSLVCSMVNAGNLYICNSFVQFSHCCVAFVLNYLYFSFGLIEILLDVSIFIVICFVAHSWVHWVLKLIETGQTFIYLLVNWLRVKRLHAPLRKFLQLIDLILRGVFILRLKLKYLEAFFILNIFYFIQIILLNKINFFIFLFV